jgi:regulator of sirC expression with transglutaminase-like and TPR domain
MSNFQNQQYGRAQRGAQNAERVLEEYAAAVQLDPNLAAPRRDIGPVFYELRDVSRAAQAFERYLQLAPDAPEAPKIRAFLNAIRVPPQ